MEVDGSIGNTSSVNFHDATLSDYLFLGHENHDFDPQQMPYEVSEPIVWSAQFVNAAYNPFLSRSTATLEE